MCLKLDTVYEETCLVGCQLVSRSLSSYSPYLLLARLVHNRDTVLLSDAPHSKCTKYQQAVRVAHSTGHSL